MSEFSEVLKKVRPLIAEGEEQYICYALRSVSAWHFRDRIASQLEVANTYESWVCVNHPDSYVIMTVDDFREGRLQWIDHMIAQEEAS